MAFLPYSYDDGQPKPFEYYGVYAGGSGVNVSIGQPMALGSGGLNASAKPAYICMRTAQAVTNGTPIPVIAAAKDMVFEAPLAVTCASFAAGMECDMTADGAVTNTTANKTVRIVELDGTGAGNLCRCRII